MLKFGSEGAKQFYDLYVLNHDHARAHREGDIHIHDLDFLTLSTNCCQIDIQKLFRGGFSTGHGTLREPNDISSYCALCCIAIQANQNDQHGGQSVANFDYGMADGVRKTFIRVYGQNLARALMLLAGREDPENEVKELISDIHEKTGLYPRLENCGEYFQAELARLSPRFGEAPEIRKAQQFAHYRAVKETDRAAYQAMEALIHNLNTMHSRAGAQAPYSSLNYGMDTSPEARMAVKNLLLATEAGLGGGETPMFPIQIFRVKEGVSYNPGDPNYDLFQLAVRCSAKRLYPNFSFLDAPYNLRYWKPGRPETEIACMGGRARVIGNAYDPSREIVNGRGNLSFTTVNLPRLALRARGDLSAFFEGLDRTLDLCVDQLLERLEIQSRKKVRNFPFLMGQGVWLDSDKLGWDDEVREVLRHGTLSVGFTGLAETLASLIGEHHGQSDRARILGLEIIGHMRARLEGESDRRGLNFSLLATPAEDLSGRFVGLDRELFGVVPGVTDRECYTDSFHIPSRFPISALDKIRIEAPYHALTDGGHITCVGLDGDPEAFEQAIRAMKESGIGYGSVNCPTDGNPA
jgi:ribonucleoside-triphosphate reductase